MLIGTEEIIEEEQNEDIEETGTPDENQPEENNVQEEVVEEDNSFVFDDKPYIEQGLDEKAIEIIKKKDLQIYNKEKFIQQRNDEIGKVRKLEIDLNKKEIELTEKLNSILSKQEELSDAFYDNPEEYNNAITDKKITERELEVIQIQRKSLLNEQIVLNNVKDFSVLLDKDIPLVIEKDMLANGSSKQETQQAITEFKSGGWKKLDPKITIAISEKASLYKQLRDKEEEIKRLKTGPDDIAKKIARIAGQRPIVNGNQNITTKNSFTDDDLSRMSHEEIKKELNKRLNKGD